MATVPCQYKTGRTLGQGTYAIVKECVSIKTGQVSTRTLDQAGSKTKLTGL